MTPEAAPRTAAGRALLGAIQGEPKPSTRLRMILAIEAEAAAPDAGGLDVERLARALHTYWHEPKWETPEMATNDFEWHRKDAAAIAAAYEKGEGS
jgi:hypothetical protein